MMQKNPPKHVSNSGATIELVTKSGKGTERKILSEECRPEFDPYLEPDCAPNYHCSPDEESAQGKAAPQAGNSDVIDEDDCQDYGCCPKKPEQECEPNV